MRLGLVLMLLVGCAPRGGAAEAKRAGDPPGTSDGSEAVDVSPGDLQGRTEIGVPRLPDDIKGRLRQKKGGRASLAAKLCINSEGVPYKVEIERSSEMVDLDQSVVDTMLGWRFRPVVRNAKMVQACSRYLFNFQAD